MTEPQRYSSSDVPEYASYPASPEEAIGRARVTELPSGEGDSNIESAARNIGSALGRAVNRVRETRDEVRNRVDEATYRLRSQAQEASRNYSELAQEKIDTARSSAQSFARRATTDYPVHVILAAAVAGVLIGAGLRIWRENRDEPYQPYPYGR
jgi:Sec-independent protein translocase protein TatA